MSENDSLRWKIDGKGRFTVKANFTHLEVGTLISVPTKLLWNSCVPPKVGFFAREAWWGKVLTTEQLKKRCFQLASRCPLCEKAEEKLEHLLIHCPSIGGLWVALISIPGLDWACPRLVKDFLMGWTLFPIRKKARNLWMVASTSLLWAIWMERNRVVFYDTPFSIDRLKLSFITLLSSWAGLIANEDLSFVRIILCILLGVVFGVVGFLCPSPLFRLSCLLGIPSVYSGVVTLAPIIFVFINCFYLPFFFFKHYSFGLPFCFHMEPVNVGFWILVIAFA